MNESTYRIIFGVVWIAYGIAMSAIMAFRPERLLAFYRRSRAWRWTFKFFFNMSAEDIVSARMVRRIRFQGGRLAVFFVLIFSFLYHLATD
ncbi:hypothetical protein BLA50215_00920 [Burkholderia lata]|uniref:hypothetical protein n=1 Tax=Burkholderia lata (strain ATCC 17760 / DSM 23089 / LMG 22485 / NCIMB 9086 / R18194 / 383) TaxID=482957 RepID=UPI0014546BEB|nr:hypothetical protein [Burkholderia lata]VWC76136.1 hypothetical protein BLA50215_00920 [Burkholderia lata]